MSQAFKSERYSEIIYGLFICFFAHVLCGHMIRNWKKNYAGMSNREWHWYYEVLSLCQMRTPKQLHSQVSEPNLYNTLQPESAHCCRAIVPPSSPSPADRSGALCVSPCSGAPGGCESVLLCSCSAKLLNGAELGGTCGGQCGEVMRALSRFFLSSLACSWKIMRRTLSKNSVFPSSNWCS